MGKLKKPILIVLIMIGVLVLAAVVLGVLNALVADGAWTFGWNDYRYDETGYQIGDGTIVSDSVTRIEIDWIDGEVELLPCQDTYLSVTESSEEDLPESAQMRWRLSEDGKTLSIKYRKSSWFFGFGNSNRDKKLTVRIPETLMAQLLELDMNVTSSKVTMQGFSVNSFDFESVSGYFIAVGSHFVNFSAETVSGGVTLDGTVTEKLSFESTSGDLLLVTDTCPKVTDLESISGKLTLQLPVNASFVLAWESVSGKLSSDLPLEQSQNRYTCGNGEASIHAETTSGNLVLRVKE